MRTLTQIETLAAAMAEMHFYADYDNEDKAAWEPFEHYPAEWIDEQMENMADMLVRVMLWAQQDTLAP
jgi:hypothetical protein